MSAQTVRCDSCDEVTPVSEIYEGYRNKCVTCRGCDTCDGTGVLFTQARHEAFDRYVWQLEKCDTCNRYADDHDAAQVVFNTWEEMNRDE